MDNIIYNKFIVKVKIYFFHYQNIDTITHNHAIAASTDAARSSNENCARIKIFFCYLVPHLKAFCFF